MGMKRRGEYDVFTVERVPDIRNMTPKAYARALEKNRKGIAQYQAYLKKDDAMRALLMAAITGKPWTKND